jgi:comEA protein
MTVMKRHLYLLQQRLALTRTEATTLAILTLLFLLGAGVRHVQYRLPPPPLDQSVAMDSLFFALSGADTTGTTVEASHPSGEAMPTAPVPAPASAGFPININRASEAELQLLPRIGPAMARRIVEHREARGPFRSIDELASVRGIGPATLEGLRPLVVVE